MGKSDVHYEGKKSKGSILVEYILITLALTFGVSSIRGGANTIAYISGTLLFILLFSFWSLRQEFADKDKSQKSN